MYYKKRVIKKTYTFSQSSFYVTKISALYIYLDYYNIKLMLTESAFFL